MLKDVQGIIYEEGETVRDEARAADKDVFSILCLRITERSMCCKV